MGILEEFSNRKAADPMNDVVKAAEEQGWRVGRTQLGHYQFFPPDRDLGMVHTSGTYSDHRGFPNFLSRMKQRGFVWPWDKQAKEQFEQQQQEKPVEEKATEEPVHNVPDYYAEQQNEEAKEDITFINQLMREGTPPEEINEYVELMDHEKLAYRKAHRAK